MSKISKLNKEKWEGKIVSSKNFGKFKVLEYKDTNHVLIEFIQTKCQLEVTLSDIKHGSIKDPYFPTVYSVGFFGIGPFSSRDENGKQYKYYKIWKEMLARCHDPKNPSYKNYGNRGIYVCDEWLNYQNYAKWYTENCTNDTFCVDKDILYKNNKVYSPKTCCFVPSDINDCFTSRRSKRGLYPMGVRKKDKSIIAQINYMGKKQHLGTFNTIEEAFNAYKIAKEKCIKEYADMYQDVITDEVYQALYNYKVEITD